MPPINPMQRRHFDGLDDSPPWQSLRGLTPGLDVTVEGEADNGIHIDPETGAAEITLPDGSVLVDLKPEPESDGREKPEDFDENLAEVLDDMILSSIASDLCEGIDGDDRSRHEWLETRANGLDLMGLKIETSKSGADGSAPLDGMSRVRHPLLNEAVLRFQANSYAELCPAMGPAKVVNYSDGTRTNDELAQSLEKDLNYYLTTTASEYYPDTDRLLWWVGFGGQMFKKVYRCPLRRRPVSEMVDAKDMIVSNTATDIENAARVTHVISMRKSVLRRMQILNVYRDIDLSASEMGQDVVDQKVASISGMDVNIGARPDDVNHKLYECYCELDIKGYEHVDADGSPTGLPLPYRVTMDVYTRKILEIRRNWEDDDEDFKANNPFISFGYVNGPGFYCQGLLHLLGNATNAVTAAWREMLDAGMFSCFPGFLYLQDGTTRQMKNEFRVAPGSGAPIRAASGLPIQQMIMPLPYKEPSAALMALIENIAATGQRVGGTAEMPVGEGVQDAPVGTTLALIEQATKIESAVHKRLHRSQARELQKMVELFRRDPGALWRGNKRTKLKRNIEKTMAALTDCDIVPQSDPNVPSRMHRLAKVAAIKQLQAMNPMLYDAMEVDRLCLSEIGVADPETLFAPPQAAQGPDPYMMADLEIRGKKVAIDQQKVALEALNKDKDRQSKERLQILQVAERLAAHPESLGVVESVLGRPATGRLQ